MYRKILVGVDGRATSMQALVEALNLASVHQSVVRVVHVVDLTPFPESGVDAATYARACRENAAAVLAVARQTARERGTEIQTALIEERNSRIPGAIVNEAGRWGADLIVMGTHGRGGLARMLLGSTAEAVVRAARLPVLLVRRTTSRPDSRRARTGTSTQDLRCPPASAVQRPGKRPRDRAPARRVGGIRGRRPTRIS